MTNSFKNDMCNPYIVYFSNRIFQIDECMTELELIMSVSHVIGSLWLWLYMRLYEIVLKLNLSWSILCEIHLSPWLGQDQKVRFESGTQPETGSHLRFFNFSLKPAPEFFNKMYVFCRILVHKWGGNLIFHSVY